MDEEVTALKATLLAQQWLLQQQEEQAAVGRHLDKAAPSITWETDHLVVLFPDGDRYEFFEHHMRYLYLQGTAVSRADCLVDVKIYTDDRIRLSFIDPILSYLIDLTRIDTGMWSLDTGKSVAYLTHSRGLAVQKALQAACAAWNLSH